MDWEALLAEVSGGCFEFLTQVSILCETPHSTILACTHRETAASLVLKLTERPKGACSTDTHATPDRVALARKLNHPALVKVFGEGTIHLPNSSVGYSLMERVMGEDLRTYVQNHPDEVTVGGLLAMIQEVAEAIDGLHHLGVLHRDIKPGNIFVDRQSGKAKLGDLGIACHVKLLQEEPVEEAWGTPEYMAPEQIVSNIYGPPVDIYALAVTIYYLLTRQHPFDADSRREVLYAKVHGEPVPVTRRNRNWPAGLHRVLSRSLSRDPGLRHTTARELVQEVAAELRAYTPYRLHTYLDGRFSSSEVVERI